MTGASGGIGRAIACALGRAGCSVVGVDVDREGLGSLGGEIDRFEALEADLLNPDVVRDLPSRLTDGGPVHVLVNNAGIVSGGESHTMDRGQWDAVLRLNLHVPIELTLGLMPELLSHREGHVLNVASVLGLLATRKVAAYVTSKHGLVGFGQAMRAEYGSRGVGVTSLCPGMVRTDLIDAARRDGRFTRRLKVPAWAYQTPEQVAARAVRAIRRNEGVVVTGKARLGWWASRIVPGVMDSGGRAKGRYLKRAPS